MSAIFLGLSQFVTVDTVSRTYRATAHVSSLTFSGPTLRVSGPTPLAPMHKLLASLACQAFSSGAKLRPRAATRFNAAIPVSHRIAARATCPAPGFLGHSLSPFPGDGMHKPRGNTFPTLWTPRPPVRLTGFVRRRLDADQFAPLWGALLQPPSVRQGQGYSAPGRSSASHPWPCAHRTWRAFTGSSPGQTPR